MASQYSNNRVWSAWVGIQGDPLPGEITTSTLHKVAGGLTHTEAEKMGQWLIASNPKAICYQVRPDWPRPH